MTLPRKRNRIDPSRRRTIPLPPIRRCFAARLHTTCGGAGSRPCGGGLVKPGAVASAPSAGLLLLSQYWSELNTSPLARVESD
jgi:hypothetical protein